MVYVPCIHTYRIYIWWSLCPLYLHVQDVPLVEFMYLVFTRTGCTSGGVYVPRFYTYRMYIWWSLCTSYLHVQDAHLVEFMYLVFTRTGCTSDGLCTLYSHVQDIHLVEFMSLVFTRTGCASGGVYVPRIYTYRMHIWWSLRTLYTYRMYLHVQDLPLVEFMYLVFTRTGFTAGGVYVPCIYTYRIYRWWSLCTLNLHACQVRVTVGHSGLCCCNYV